MLQTHPLHRGPSGLLLQDRAASSLALFGTLGLLGRGRLNLSQLRLQTLPLTLQSAQFFVLVAHDRRNRLNETR